MGLFNFVSGGVDRLFGGLDTKMTQTMNIGVETMRSHAHVLTGYNKSTIGGTYDKSAKRVQIHIDSGYGAYEAARGGAHDFITPGTKAMGRYWGGDFEIHLPNVAIGRHGAIGLKRLEGALYRRMGRSGRKTRIISRRWHKRFPEIDDAGIIL